METELTKAMKKSIRNYNPALGSSLRTVRWAEEVTTGTGIVDSIRFEDYIAEDRSFCSRSECKFKGKDNKVDNKKCHGCFYKRNEHILGMLITCFEMKISKSDFKSRHGHNFVGNHNYYVIPKELYEKVKDLVREDIGIIVYYPSGALIKKKECKFLDVSKEMQVYLLYNALKKWVDDGDKHLYYKMVESEWREVSKRLTMLYDAIRKELGDDKLLKIYKKYGL